MQWHPLFAFLLQRLLGPYYTVDVEQAVSELPRRADLLVLRRLGGAAAPFTGLWANLREWNVFELKGPTDHPENLDLELLLYVGCGIALKLQEERLQQNQPLLPATQVTLWYLAPSLGETFTAAALERAPLSYHGGGVWSGRAWGHPVYLVGYRDLPVEIDSVPLHLLRHPGEVQPPHELAELLVAQPDLLHSYSGWIATLQAPFWQEMGRMASLVPPEWINWQEVFAGVDVKHLIRALDPKQVLEVWKSDPKQVIDAWGPDLAAELLGSEEVVRHLKPDQLKALTPEQRTQGLTPDQLLNAVPPEKLEELFRLFQQRKQAGS